MQKWRDFDFGYLLAVVLAFSFMGFIYGLVVYAAVGIVLDAPLWPLGLTLFFSIFHWSDLRVMSWGSRIIRLTWIFVMAAAVSGIVWLFVPKEDWLQPLILPYFLIMPMLGACGGLVLGLIEGIKPHTIRPHLNKLAQQWKSVGGY